MKKLLVFLTSMAFVVGMTVGGAWAATGVSVYATQDTDDPARSYKVATEGYDLTNGLDGAAVGNAVYVIMTTGTLNPISIDVSLTNGQFYSAANTYYLAVWVDADADGVIDDTELTVVTDNAAAALAGGAAAGALSFDPGDGNGLHQDPGNTGVAQDIPTGSKLVIIDDGDADPTLTLPVAVEVMVDFGLDSGLAADSLLTWNLIENQGTAYEKTASTTLVKIFNQYVAGVTTPADGVIDVGATPSRTDFTTNDDTDAVTVNIADRNGVATNVAPFNDALLHNSGTEYLLVQGPGGGSIDDIAIVLYGSDQAIATVNDGADLVYDATDLSWTSTSVTDVVAGANTPCIFTITVNGTDVIDVRSFKSGLVSDPVSADFATVTYLPADTSAGSWTLNGYQARIPYVALGAYSGYVSFLKINNHSNVTGAVAVDAIIHDYTSDTDTTVTNASLGTSTSNTLITVSQSDLVTALGLDATHQYHVSLLITINVPEVQAEIAAFQKDAGGGRTMIPVYPTGVGMLVQ